MPLVLKELGSPEATNRRNAAFCVGELCKNGGETALKYPFATGFLVLAHFNSLQGVKDLYPGFRMGFWENMRLFVFP